MRSYSALPCVLTISAHPLQLVTYDVSLRNELSSHHILAIGIVNLLFFSHLILHQEQADDTKDKDFQPSVAMTYGYIFIYILIHVSRT